MFNPSRAEARQFLFDAWKKYRSQGVLSGLEAIAVEHLLAHPEYHRWFDDPQANLDRDWPPEAGETNPFLHLMMHIGIAEQLSIDQPVGIRERYLRLATRLGDPHTAQHAVMDCLAETLWRAQRDAAPPDGDAYLHCLDRSLR